MAFDPDAAGAPGSGIFGLPHTREEAGVVLVPVPFDATTSYGHGAAKGPGAILRASMQVDLFDRRFGRIYERGIYMELEDERIGGLSEEARRSAAPLIETGGAGPGDHAAVARVDAAGDEVNRFTYERFKRILAEGKAPGLIGGDHSTPFGAIRACAEHAGELGILHLDAHMDLRREYEGFRWSHASIMHNVLTLIPRVSRVVQVGIRDFGAGEMDLAAEQGQRVVTFYDDLWAQGVASGTPFLDLARKAVAALPERVYISFDIDALDPSLCPHTGTPVPGGLSFNQAVLLLDLLRQSGKRVVGFDLVEVAPGSGGDEWDANVGARVLYKLCGVVSPLA